MSETEPIFDSFWRLLAAFLVLFMQAGFLLVEAGGVRERNTVSVAQKNATDLALCWVIFAVFGYTLGFGMPSPLLEQPLTLEAVSQFIFQLGFCGAAATIISGAVAERMRFQAYLLLTVLVAGLLYPAAVWLVWGDALVPERVAPMGALGFVDHAGAAVVHTLSGSIALAAIFVLGPRAGRFTESGEVNEMYGHSPVLQMLGVLILVLGWLGFNGGVLPLSDPGFPLTIMNTVTAACFGAITGLVVGYRLDRGVFNPRRTITGLLAGLVGVTACAPYASVPQTAALAFSVAVAALLCSDWILQRLRLDDPLDVVATHGVAGVIGTLFVAAVLPEAELQGASRFDQLQTQTLGVLCIGLFGALSTYCFLKLFNGWHPIRVNAADEAVGLNYTEHGVMLNSDLLRRSLHSTLGDEGGFADRAELRVDGAQDQTELAVALGALLQKHADARATIERQSERFYQFAATTNDLLWETDEHCILSVLMANGDTLSAADAEALRGQFLFDCFQIDMRSRADVLQSLVERRPLSRLDVRCELGERKRLRDFSLSGVPYFDAQGAFAGYRGGLADVTEQKLAEERALFLANHDQLTGLMNRRALEAQLLRIQGSSRAAVAIIDLDSFKAVNDENGHQVGDQLLCSVAKLICAQVRDRDQVFRIGGDEFVVLLHELRDAFLRDDALLWGQRMIHLISEPHDLQGQPITVGACIGVSVFPDDGRDVEDLLRLADLALYEAKASGKGRVVAFDRAMEELAQEERMLQQEIEVAFAEKQFFLTYQPKLSVATGALLGVEALLRWQHPERGVLAPDTFLRTIEKMGRIVTLGSWVLHEACAEVMTWPQSEIHVAVNVAPAQLGDPNFVATVREALRMHGLPPQRLELELTEQSLVSGYAETGVLLQQLRSMGVSIAVDDFGCGSTSLQYLHRLPVDKLKIDKSFVRNLVQDERAREIARSIVQLAHELGLTVTAEGVEEESQLETLAEWFCDETQGYLFSRPLPADELVARWMSDPGEDRQRSWKGFAKDLDRAS